MSGATSSDFDQLLPWLEDVAAEDAPHLTAAVTIAEHIRDAGLTTPQWERVIERHGSTRQPELAMGIAAALLWRADSGSEDAVALVVAFIRSPCARVPLNVLQLCLEALKRATPYSRHAQDAGPWREAGTFLLGCLRGEAARDFSVMGTACDLVGHLLANDLLHVSMPGPQRAELRRVLMALMNAQGGLFQSDITDLLIDLDALHEA